MSGSSHPISQATSIAARITALKNALFQALSVMQKKSHVPPALTILGIFVKWLQMMAFLFALDWFAWDKAVIEPLRVLAVIPSPAGWFNAFDPTFLQVMFYISFGWVFVFCSLMVWTVNSFLHGRIPSLAPLRVLATIGQFSATVAYIPLLTLLLSVYTCDSPPDRGAIRVVNPWNGYTCYRGGHLALVVLATAFATAFACLAALFALVFYDNHPLSSNLGAKVHGRAELVMLVVKTALVLGIEIFPAQINNVWAMVALNIVASVAWASTKLYYLPLINFNMNVLHLALSCVYIWGSICLAIVTAAPQIQAASFLYLASPVALLVGVSLAHFRRRSVMALPGFKLNSAYEVEMKARFTLQHALAKLLNQASQQHSSAWSDMSPYQDADETSSAASPRADADEHAATKGGRTAHTHRTVAPGPSGNGDARSRRSGAGGESDFALFGVSYKAMDAESRERMVRDRLPNRVLNEVDTLFKDAAMRFPTSAILHMFQSRFYAVFRHDKHLATSHLLLTNRLGPSLDVAYLAFQARRAAETGAGAGVLSSAMHRLSFDKHLADARHCTTNAAKAQLAFWQELSDPAPDINQLHRIATDLSRYTSMAEAHFKEVFVLHPQSLAAMRLFAQYNMSVANNAEKAAAISAEAERIEDQKNKEQNAQKAMAGVTQGFPFLEEVPMENMTDAAAIMTVGATSRDLGIILSANSACAKLLGYTRLQLERRNVSIIVPPPFMEDHDSYLRRYLSTGEGLLIEASHNFLGKHRLGHLIPFTLLLRESTLSDNTPVFTATLRPLNFTDHVVMMDEDWIILGGTAGALMALQVEAATLTAAEVCMADYCPMLNDAVAVTDLMGRATGNVVQMMLPGFAGASSSGEASSAPTPLATGAGLASARSKSDPWAQKAVDVKTTLASSTVKGHTINILTFRVLSSNEKAQRATALASRRASMALGTPILSGRQGILPSARHDPEEQGSLQIGNGGLSSRKHSSRLSKATLSDQSSDDDSIRQAGAPLTENGAEVEGASQLPSGHPVITAATFADGAKCPVMSGRVSPPAGAGLNVDNLTPRSTDSIGLRITESSSKPPGPLLTTKKSGVRIMEGETPRFQVPTLSISGAVSPLSPAADPHTALSTTILPSTRAEPTLSPHPQPEGIAYAPTTPRDTEDRESPRDHDGDPAEKRSGTGDGRSVRSGRSSSSRRSGISRGTINKLRRILSDSAATSPQEARKSVPGLSALYVTGWLLVLLNIGLGALTAALLDTNFAAYERNLRFAEIASDASQLQVQSQRRLVLRLNYKKGYVRMTPEEDAQNMAEMMKLADDQSDLIRAMHELVMGTPREAFFTEPRLTYADYRGSVPEPISRFTLPLVRDMLLGDQFWPRTMSNGDVIVAVRRKTSLNDFTSMWSGQVKQFATTPISNLTLDDFSVIFLTVNTQAGAPALEYVRSSVYESYLSTEESQQSVSELVLWIFVGMGPLLSLLLVAMLAPILVYIDHRRDDVMEAFLDVPNLIVMHLRGGAEKRLRALRSDDEDGEASDDDYDDDDAARTAIAMADGQAVVDLELDDGTVDWDAVIAMAARDEKLRLKRLGATDPKAPAPPANKGTAPVAPAPSDSCCCSRSQRVNPQRFYQRSMCSRGVRGPGGFYRSVRNSDGTLFTFVRRDFKKSKLAVLKLGVFLVPITVMFIFYLTLYLVTLNTASQIKALTSFSTLSAIRQSCIRTSRTNLYFMVSSPAYPPSLAFRFEWTAMQIATLTMANGLLTFDMLPDPDPLDANIAPALKYKKAPGTELTTIAGISAEVMADVRRAHTSDACPFIGKSKFALPTFNMEACRAYNGRVLTSGLQAALRDFIVRARRLRDRRYNAAVPVTTRTGQGILYTTNTPGWAQYYDGRPITGFADGVDFIASGGTYVGTVPAGTSAIPGATGSNTPAVTKTGINGTLAVSIANYSIPEELAGEDWNTLFDMGTDYLLPAFQALSEKYKTAGLAVVLQYRVFIPAFVGGFLVLFVLGTMLLYLPSITRLGQDVQSKRAMLLLLPAEVISTIPSLKQMVLQIVAESEGAASARSMHSSGGGPIGSEDETAGRVEPLGATAAE